MKQSRIYILFVVMLQLFTLVGTAMQVGATGFDDPNRRRASDSGGGGDFTAVTGLIDAGEVVLGATSQVVLLFRNDGVKPINSGLINLYPSSNVSASVGLNQCAQEPLEPEAVCAIALSVKGLQSGSFRIEMLMRHDGRSRLITSTVTGSVPNTEDAADEIITDVEALPDALDFGTLDASRTLVRSTILRNITSDPVTIKSIEIEAAPSSGFSMKHDCTSLVSGQACLANITWTPLQSGPSSGVLVIRHDGPTGITIVNLSGSYEPTDINEAEVFPDPVPGKGLLISSQAEVDFGSSIQTSSAITLSLVNVGDAPMIIDDIRLSNDENGIIISQRGCKAGTELDPVAACALTLTWEPTREGGILDDIQILHNGARGILVIPVRGDASAAVNKDTKAIVVSDTLGGGTFLQSIPPISEDDLESADIDVDGVSGQLASLSQGIDVSQLDIRGALDGYSITSHAPRRAIIAGPGGSRVVFHGEQTVIGGILWEIKVRPNAVEFQKGDQKVLLLFDRSLSSINRNSTQSTGDDAPAEEADAQ